MTAVDLSGRAAIVTGAGRGRGRAIAVALAARGVSVAVAARTERVWDDRLPGTIGQTVADIEAAGGRAVGVRADLLDPEDRHRLVAQAREALGPITILVNNAAFTAPGRPPRPGAASPPDKAANPPRLGAPGGSADAGATKPGAAESNAAKPAWPSMFDIPLAAYRRHFEISVFAAHELMQLVRPDMIAAGVGAVVNITSAASRLPGSGPYPDRNRSPLAGYGGAKAALEHLTQCAAYDLAGHNIAVNALSPSTPIGTPGLSYWQQFDRGFDDMASAEEFARAAVLLAQVDPAAATGRVTDPRSQTPRASVRSLSAGRPRM